ncbi:MAG: glycosyltransferase family 2 protein [Bacteroidetes bacterium]|nr:glycosyltransferase family 2 protein [Rhodothermia bacterium]MCS7154696.1 glycosyltransferase family 2 protein [Bacteroidota bacterium]MCX7907147.1 glycosyltransferase family 2 protein [Bacteroidota bacterium]MDW8137489.1 glycosyltransferase family A protein [Bacteroidota bacterium]MDW8285557.1 glycosyltransferase family A protein [Bacteroidota bacterium]
MRPLVSVILPVYRRPAEWLCEAIASVREQHLSDWELLIVDDGSEDEEARRAFERFRDERLRFYKLPQNRGPAGARNVGACLARGRYLAFLDSDDRYLPHRLQRHSELLEAHSEVGFVYGELIGQFPDGRLTSRPLQGKGRALPSGWIAPALLRRSFIRTSAVTVRQAAFLSVGGFDEALRWNEDDDLWFRLALRYPVLFCPDPVAVYRFHPGRMSLKRTEAARYQIATYAKYLSWYPELMRALSAPLRRRLLGIGRLYVSRSLGAGCAPDRSVLGALLKTLRQLRRLRRLVPWECA